MRLGYSTSSLLPITYYLNHGGIAQLGEHLLCKQGVIGSIPIISTSASQCMACKWAHSSGG